MEQPNLENKSLQPDPDPGNSPPEVWTEPLSDDEVAEVHDLLQREWG